MELKLIKEEIADLEKSRAVGTLTPYGCRYLKELTYIIEQLSLHPVSQQRELLINYMKWFDDNRDMYYEISNKEMIDKYIVSKCCPKCGCNKITGDGSKAWCLNSNCDFITNDC